MIVVSDTSPILNLAVVDQLHLLRALYQVVVVTPAVMHELSRNGFTSEEPWLTVVSPMDRSDLESLLGTLDPGEAEAIVVATQVAADLLLLDEKRGRRIAKQRGLHVTGLLGVLAEAKMRGLLSLCGPTLDAMMARGGFWIGNDLRTLYLQGLGEL